MKALPMGWRVHHGRDPERELRRLKRRFRAVSRRHERAMKLRQVYRWAKVSTLAASGAFVSIWL